jgi:hypothetical protein
MCLMTWRATSSRHYQHLARRRVGRRGHTRAAVVPAQRGQQLRSPRHAAVQRRKLDLKAKIECDSSYCSFKHLVPGAWVSSVQPPRCHRFNLLGFIGSSVTGTWVSSVSPPHRCTDSCCSQCRGRGSARWRRRRRRTLLQTRRSRASPGRGRARPGVAPARSPRSTVAETKHSNRDRSKTYFQGGTLMQTRGVCGGGGGESTSVECSSSITPLPRGPARSWP